MCLIVALISAMYALNSFNNNDPLVGSLSLVVSIFFVWLMIKNIFYVKNLKKEKKDDN